RGQRHRIDQLAHVWFSLWKAFSVGPRFADARNMPAGGGNRCEVTHVRRKKCARGRDSRRHYRDCVALCWVDALSIARTEIRMEHASAPGAMIVTGGGRGIGAAVCRLAARRGYAVAVNFAESADAADSLVGELRNAGAHAIAVQGDVSVEGDVTRM